MTFFLFFLLVLGAARVTWFITEDHLPLIAKPRQRLIDRNPEGNLAYLINCWWCTSIYVSAIAAAVAVWVFDIPFVVYPMAHEQVFFVLAEWKEFLILWPAFSFAAVLVMSFVDTIQNYGTDD